VLSDLSSVVRNELLVLVCQKALEIGMNRHTLAPNTGRFSGNFRWYDFGPVSGSVHSYDDWEAVILYALRRFLRLRFSGLSMPKTPSRLKTDVKPFVRSSSFHSKSSLRCSAQRASGLAIQRIPAHPVEALTMARPSPSVFPSKTDPF
jgi:hypothetical protein